MINLPPSPCNKCYTRELCEQRRSTCTLFRQWLRFSWRTATNALRAELEARKQHKAVFQYRAPYEPESTPTKSKAVPPPVPPMSLLVVGARDTLRWTQKFFAKKIGVTQAAVSSWELGLFKPSLEQILKIRAIEKVTHLFPDRVMEVYYGNDWKTGN